MAEAIERALALADVEACGRLLHDRESRDEFERGIGIGAVVDGCTHLVERQGGEAGGIENAPYGVRFAQGEGLPGGGGGGVPRLVGRERAFEGRGPLVTIVLLPDHHHETPVRA